MRTNTLKMTKRMYVTLSDSTASALERWAVHKGDKPTSLAAFILTTEVDKAEAEGKIPKINEEERRGQLCCQFIKDLADGKDPEASDITLLAYLLGINAEELLKIRNRALNGDSNEVKS